MSITIRPCGHSDETASRYYSKYPDRCFYCEYLQNHPRPERVVSDRQKAHLNDLNSRLRAERLGNRSKPRAHKTGA